MQSKKNEGFTLLEIMIVVTILGILSAAASYGITNYVKEKRSEQHSVALWSELNTLRARAIKDNCFYLVQFNTGAGTYAIYKNNLNDCNTASSSSDPITAGVGEASGNITLGLADNFPTSGTERVVGGITPAAGTFVYGSWASYDHDSNAGTAAKTDMIVFENNEIGSITDGAIFIRNTAVKTVGYAIIKAASGHTIKLYKWDGSKWYEM